MKPSTYPPQRESHATWKRQICRTNSHDLTLRTRSRVFGMALLLFCGSSIVFAQDAKPAAEKKADAPAAAAAAPTVAAASPANANAAGVPQAETTAPTAGATPVAAGTNTDASATNAASDEIQLSLQGANIDMVVQWLAQTTGKTVIKHPRVQCQLTIINSKKLTKREAITLVYRALSLEGFTATESSNAIM